MYSSYTWIELHVQLLAQLQQLQRHCPAIMEVDVKIGPSPCFASSSSSVSLEIKSAVDSTIAAIVCCHREPPVLFITLPMYGVLFIDTHTLQSTWVASENLYL